MLRVEFTIEPFVEGQPGPHVLEAVAAVEALGLAVEFGPFSSSFTAEGDAVAAAVSVLLGQAYAHGATHVSLHIEPADAGDVGLP
ncbi:MAG: hypothetical protein ACO3SP_00380 [Ilumatobacteraceae bacterium]